MNKILNTYLKIKGRHHTNLDEFFCEILNETKGNILGNLLENGFKDIRQLEQFLLPNQIKSGMIQEV